MTNARRRYPMADQLLKTHPRKLPFLATPRKRAVPKALDMVDKATQRGAVERHSIILVVSAQHCADPLALLFQWAMHASPKFPLQFFQLRLHTLAHRLAYHREPSRPRLPANMREAEKVERFRFALPTTLPSTCCMSTELDHASLLFMQFQLKLSQSLAQFALKPLSLVSLLKA